MSVVRIIPARAGFTVPAVAFGTKNRDHPRSRGVYRLHGVKGPDGCGSSPLARGLPETPIDTNLWWWIIPARAGFTGSPKTYVESFEDHPRSRGVYELRTDLIQKDLGSSPLARGLRTFPAAIPSTARIIPARAGFTIPHNHAIGGAADHPRSRGVYKCAILFILRWEGSSPLARGLPVLLAV